MYIIVDCVDGISFGLHCFSLACPINGVIVQIFWIAEIWLIIFHNIFIIYFLASGVFFTVRYEDNFFNIIQCCWFFVDGWYKSCLKVRLLGRRKKIHLPKNCLISFAVPLLQIFGCSQTKVSWRGRFCWSCFFLQLEVTMMGFNEFVLAHYISLVRWLDLHQLWFLKWISEFCGRQL